MLLLDKVLVVMYHMKLKLCHNFLLVILHFLYGGMVSYNILITSKERRWEEIRGDKRRGDEKENKEGLGMWSSSLKLLIIVCVECI